MEYEPTEWVDGKEPYLEASNLNKIEKGLVDCKNAINSLSPSGGGDSGELIFDKHCNAREVGNTQTLLKPISNFKFITFVFNAEEDVQQYNSYMYETIPVFLLVDNYEQRVTVPNYSTRFFEVQFSSTEVFKITRMSSSELYKIYGIY